MPCLFLVKNSNVFEPAVNDLLISTPDNQQLRAYSSSNKIYLLNLLSSGEKSFGNSVVILLEAVAPTMKLCKLSSKLIYE